MSSMQRYPALGRLASELIAIMEGCEDDPISHECGIFPDYTRPMVRVVQDAGFKNLRHFYAVLRGRVSERWVHDRMPSFTVEEDN